MYTLTVDTLDRILFDNHPFSVPPQVLADVERCYHFLEEFSADKVIYGINTGFGPMAQWKVEDEDLAALQYNIIRSHATGAGAPLEDIYVKAAMLARVGTVLQCRSGIHVDVVKLLVDVINLGS